MRNTALVCLSIPGIVLAQDAGARIKAISEVFRERQNAYYEAVTAAAKVKTAPPQSVAFFGEDIRAAEAALGRERDPDVRAALKLTLVAYRAGVTLSAHSEGLDELTQVSPASPAWGVGPTLFMLAATRIKDEPSRKAFLAKAEAESPVAELREQLLLSSFVEAHDSKREEVWKAKLRKLETDFPDSVATREARKILKADKAAEVGDPAPAFDVVSLEDPRRHFTLDTYKGQYLLMDFWATWCGPCKVMLPTMERLYQDYRGRGLRILGLADDKGVDVVQAFRKTSGFSMPWDHAVNIYDRELHRRLNPISEDYGIRALPSLFLIGPDGRVLAKGEELHTDLGAVLARFIPPAGAGVDYEVLKKERDGLAGKLGEQWKAYKATGKPDSEFHPDLTSLLAELRAKENATAGEEKEARLVIEFTILARAGGNAGELEGILKQVPCGSRAWTLAEAVLPALESLLGPKAGPYVESFKAGGAPSIRVAFGVGDFVKALEEDGDRAKAGGILDRLEKLDPGNEQLKVARRMYDADAKTLVGTPAPAFSVPSLEDPARALTLDAFKGKYLLLDFWGTWCGWCVKELPVTHRAYQKFRTKGLEILSLSTDKKIEDVQAFRKKPGTPMPWKHAFLGADRKHPILGDYGVMGYPSLYLLGPDGRILAKGDALRAENLERTLARFLGGNQ